MSLGNFDFVVIGAGIVGLALGRSLLQKFPGCRIAMIDKEKHLALHASGRNSGVLHSGVYYAPSTLKAKLCVSGNRALTQFCDEHALPILKSGKVVVPTCPEDEPQLDRLYNHGVANGTKVRIIDQKELQALEPASSREIPRALFTEETSVVDPKTIVLKLAETLREQGVKFFLGETPQRFSSTSAALTLRQGSLSAGKYLNASGAFADRVAHLFGLTHGFAIVPFRGRYFKLKKSAKIQVNGNIYPVPNLQLPFLGVHFTRSVNQDVYVGPTAFPAFGRENYHGLETFNLVDASRIALTLGRQILRNQHGLRNLMIEESKKLLPHYFFAAARKLVPTLKSGDLEPCDKVGIRPQLVNNKNLSLEMDFLIEQNEVSIHILNAISPAFTCSFSFADYLIEQYVLMSSDGN